MFFLGVIFPLIHFFPLPEGPATITLAGCRIIFAVCNVVRYLLYFSELVSLKRPRI